jgi:hypothetical protein
MDVVYPYRSTVLDLELRFSIRSLANVEHGKVIVAGDRPRFLSGAATYVQMQRDRLRFRSSTHNIAAAAQEAVETDRFIVMNDDIFVLRPWAFQHEHRGTIEEYLASGRAIGSYQTHVVATRDILKAHGVDEPLFFGLHTPTVYERTKLLDLVKDFDGQPYLLRTLYHNLFPRPSALRADVKLKTWSGAPVGADVISITDNVAWKPSFRAWLVKTFPEPSPYEAASSARRAA